MIDVKIFRNFLQMLEAIAKLPDPEKSMILSQFASRLSGRRPIPEHILQASRALGWGGKMAQKSDFAVAWSFAIASLVMFSLIPNLIYAEKSHQETENQSNKEEEKKDEDLLPLGNFSVPLVTQISPLISFGQLLIGKNALLHQLTGIYAQGHDNYDDVIAPNVIYGIRDDLSVFFSLPFTPRSRSGSSHSSGIEDIFLQGEYGFYNKTRADYTLQATVLANVQFPTGSSSKNPPTGHGSFGYFLGTTYAYTSFNWYAFISPGVNLTTTHHGTKFGNSYLYQWGFARCIKQLSPRGWIFDLMIEFDGTYAEKNKIRGITDLNSGGNVIFVTPSIWLSSKRWIFQWGIGFPLVQNLNGHQDKLKYSIDYNLGIAAQF